MCFICEGRKYISVIPNESNRNRKIIICKKEPCPICNEENNNIKGRGQKGH